MDHWTLVLDCVNCWNILDPCLFIGIQSTENSMSQSHLFKIAAQAGEKMIQFKPPLLGLIAPKGNI